MQSPKRIAALSCAALLPLMLYANTAAADYFYNNVLQTRHFDATIAYNYTPNVDGFMQTPIGGTPGTSSYERPTFDEVGIKTVSFYTLDARYIWDHWFVFGAYQYLRPDGKNVLTQDLETHGQNIPAGTAINVKSEFDLHKLGVGYNLGLWLDYVNIFATLEEDYWKFNYKFSTPSLIDQRAYTQTTTRGGLGVHIDINNMVALEIKGAASFPYGNLEIYDIGGRVEFNVYNTEKIAVSPYLGVAYQQINYLDKQTLPNFVIATLNPYYTVGVKIAM